MVKAEEADRGVEAEDVDNMPPAVPAGTRDDSRGTLRHRPVGAKQQINKKSEQIFVKNLKGKTLTLDVDLSGTIDDVMAIVKEKDRLPNSEILKREFFFLFEKKVVDNGKPLSEFHIKKGSTLTLTARMRGGDSRNSQLDTFDLEGRVSDKEPPSNPRAWLPRISEISWEWLNNAFSLVVYGDYTTGSGLDDAKGKKCLSNYSIKAVLFSITMLSSYLTNPTSTSSSCTNQDILFMIAFLFFIIADAILLVVLPKKYSNALVCISWFLLELVSCLVSNLFNGGYIALAILVVPLPTIVVVAIAHQLLQKKVEKYLLSFNNNGVRQGIIGHGNLQEENLKDQENQHFDHLFDLSQGIANCGGLITAVISDDHNYVVGFFFFFTIALALYLMMVITVRAVSCPHATCLAIVLIFSFLITIIAAFISFVRRSGIHPQLEIKDLAGPF